MGNRALSKFPPALCYLHHQTNTLNSSCSSAAPDSRDGDPRAQIVTHTFLEPKSTYYTGPCLVNFVCAPTSPLEQDAEEKTIYICNSNGLLKLLVKIFKLNLSSKNFALHLITPRPPPVQDAPRHVASSPPHHLVLERAAPKTVRTCESNRLPKMNRLVKIVALLVLMIGALLNSGMVQHSSSTQLPQFAPQPSCTDGEAKNPGPIIPLAGHPAACPVRPASGLSDGHPADCPVRPRTGETLTLTQHLVVKGIRKAECEDDWSKAEFL